MKLYDREISTLYEQGRTIHLWSIFFPKLLELVSISLLGNIHSMLLANFDEEAAVAVSVGSQVLSIFYIILNIFSNGHLIISSIYLGANKRKEAGISACSVLTVSVVLSIILGALLAMFPQPFMHMMHLDGIAFQYGCTYLSIMIGFSVFNVFNACFNSFLISIGQAKCVLWVNLLRNLLSIAFGYIVLFRPFETPLYGVSGIAIGRVLSQAIAAAVAAFFVVKRRCPFEHKIQTRAIISAGKIGLPGSMGNLSYTFSQTVASSMISSLGLHMISAKVFATNILGFVANFSSSIADSNSILIGRCKGKGDYDRAGKLFMQNLLIALCMNLSLVLLINFFRVPLFRLFTTDPSILALIWQIALIDIFVEAARAINHIAERSLIATADVRFVTAVSTSSCWLVSIGLGWLFGIGLGLGLVGFWIAFAADEVVRCCAYLIRWHKGRWKNIRI